MNEFYLVTEFKIFNDFVYRKVPLLYFLNTHEFFSENPPSYSLSLSVLLQLFMLVYNFCIPEILSHKREIWFPLFLLPHNMYNNFNILHFVINLFVVFYIYCFTWHTYVKEQNFVVLENQNNM